MNFDHDPVDRALESLRSDAWTPAQHKFELEEKLMREFNSTKSRPGIAKHRTLLVALGVLLLGGVGFAAAGGVAKLRSYLVTVEIQGNITDVELDENGEKTLVINTDDGTATVSIKTSGTPEEGLTTSVQILRQDGETEDELEDCRIVRKVMHEQDAGEYTLDDLGDAEPLAEWTDADDLLNELFIISHEDGEGSQIYVATTDQRDQTTVRLLAAPPVDLLAGDIEPQVSVGDDGMITIKLDDGNDQVQMIKLMTRRIEGADQVPSTFRTETPDGEIKVQVEVIEGE